MARISLAGLSSPTILAAASVVKGFVLPIEKLPATDCDAVAPITLEQIEMASETVKSEKKQRRALAQSRRDSLVGRHVAGAKSKKSYMICTGSILLGEEVTLVGKPRFDHFFACEGDPTIYGIEYGPLYLQKAPVSQGSNVMKCSAHYTMDCASQVFRKWNAHYIARQ